MGRVIVAYCTVGQVMASIGGQGERKPVRNKFLVFVLTALFLAAVNPSHAQQTGKIFRIGFLDPSTASGSAGVVEVFLQELGKLGWIEGKNFIIEYRFGEQKPERVPELAADLVRLKVDLIWVSGITAALAAKKATTTIPIVMTSVVDPVGAGLVASLARPGGNVTGFSSLGVRAKYQKARDTQGRSPQARPSWTSAATGRQRTRQDLQLKELRPAAVALKLKLEEIETQRDPKGLESAFQTAKQKQVGAIMTTHHSPLFRRKKADRRACRQISVAGYLLPEGVCR